MAPYAGDRRIGKRLNKVRGVTASRTLFARLQVKIASHTTSARDHFSLAINHDVAVAKLVASTVNTATRSAFALKRVSNTGTVADPVNAIV